MIVWLYTEDDEPLTDGPFPDLETAKDSFLWQWEGACLWLEHRSRKGWFYENVRFVHETEFHMTSTGLRPIPPVRPAKLEESDLWRRLQMPQLFPRTKCSST